MSHKDASSVPPDSAIINNSHMDPMIFTKKVNREHCPSLRMSEPLGSRGDGIYMSGKRCVKRARHAILSISISVGTDTHCFLSDILAGTGLSFVMFAVTVMTGHVTTVWKCGSATMILLFSWIFMSVIQFLDLDNAQTRGGVER